MKIFEGNSIGQQISEHFTNFTDSTLLAKKPIPNWPEQFGQLAAEAINQEGGSGRVKVLVVHGGVGRGTLEILRSCQVASQLSIVNCQLSTVNCQLLTIYFLLSTVYQQM